MSPRRSDGSGWRPSEPRSPGAAVDCDTASGRRSGLGRARRRGSVDGAAVPLLVATLAAALATASPGAAEDWPQWRGPGRDGRSAESGLLRSWPEAGPPLSWRAQGLGVGYSSVSVADGRIYTMGDLEDGQYVIALSRADGRLLWRTRVGPAYVDDYPGPRATPTVSGDAVFAMTTEGVVVRLDSRTGSEGWRRSLPEEFGGYLMKAMGSYDWRFSESPLVDGDRVVVTPGHIQALMVALDPSTGEERWRTQGRRLGPLGSDGAAYASAVVSEAAGVRQYVQLVGRGLIGVAAGTGELLWSYNRVASDIANIATPIVRGEHVFASTGYGTGAALLRLVAQEGAIEAREVYFLEAGTLQNHHGGMVLHEDTLFTGTGHNRGFPIAIDWLSGAVNWGPIRTEGRGSAAVSYADGRLYFRFQDGQVVLVHADPEEYREAGRFVIPEVERESWSHPVITDGRLLLREQDKLFCYDVRDP